MNIRQLRNFIRIVELGSFSRAAREIYVAQPALSQQIASLERELGTALLIRDARGIKPTEAGARLHQTALSVMLQLERVRHQITNAKDEPSGQVSIGLPPSTAVSIGVPLLREVRRRYRKITLQMTESVSGGLKEMLLQGRLDMAVLVNESASRNLVARKLLSGDLFLLSPPESGANRRRRRIPQVRLSDFAGQSFVLPRTSIPLRQRIDNVLASAGIELNVDLEIDSVSTAKAAVEAGPGWTILPWYALSGQAESVPIRCIVDPPVRWDISLCTLDSVPSSYAVSVVLDTVAKVVATLAESKTWPGIATPETGSGGTTIA